MIAHDFNGGTGVYLNKGDRFVDAAAQFGFYGGGASMGIGVGDVNNDGVLDIHITGMSSSANARIYDRMPGSDTPDVLELKAALASLIFMFRGNNLYRGLGDGRFGAPQALRSNWGWGGGFLDFDNDGWTDLHSPNGYYSGAHPGDT